MISKQVQKLFKIVLITNYEYKSSKEFPPFILSVKTAGSDLFTDFKVMTE